MAGIGFVLRELDRRETLTGSLSSAGHGMVVAAGPWIFTVVSLALIHRGTAQFLASEVSYSFRSFVMYSFAVSLLATAPIVNTSVRLASDDIFRTQMTNVRGRYIAAMVCSAAVSALVAFLLHSLVFRLSTTNTLVMTGATAVVSLIWPTLAFCGAVRDYRGITAGFALGMLLSILATIWISKQGYGAPIMIVAFLSGLCVVFFALASRILLTFPDEGGGIGRHFLDLWDGLRDHRVLALGSLFAIAAVWADKWVMWFGPDQVVLPNGLVSAPLYDGAMFMAYLVMIPALGLFVTAIETTFFEDSRRLLDAVQNQAPMRRIERLHADFERRTYQTIYRVLTTLGGLCALTILISPSIMPYIGLQYQQIGVFRLGLLSVFFQFMFVSATSVILFLDKQVRFMLLQTLFLVLQISLSLLSIRLGHEYLGYGHLVACAVSAFIAVAVLENTMTKIVFLTFSAALRHPGKKNAAAAVKEKKVHNPIEIEIDDGALPPLSGLRPGPILKPF